MVTFYFHFIYFFLYLFWNHVYFDFYICLVSINNINIVTNTEVKKNNVTHIELLFNAFILNKILMNKGNIVNLNIFANFYTISTLLRNFSYFIICEYIRFLYIDTSIPPLITNIKIIFYSNIMKHNIATIKYPILYFLIYLIAFYKLQFIIEPILIFDIKLKITKYIEPTIIP